MADKRIEGLANRLDWQLKLAYPIPGADVAEWDPVDRPKFYEFFAGGGMARAGLGSRWECVFANDIDPIKNATYRVNWGADHLMCGDVQTVQPSVLPGRADLVWASFPCQDLSLAGNGAGLGQGSLDSSTRSGTFWPFWRLIRRLTRESRAPGLIVLENVCGILSSRDGCDFGALCSAIIETGYRLGALIVDAAHFVPQSRQRVFFIAVPNDWCIPCVLQVTSPHKIWHPPALVEAYTRLSAIEKRNWVWWTLPEPPGRSIAFADVIEDRPSQVAWNTLEQTSRLLAMMSPCNAAKVEAAQRSGKQVVGCIYKRTRPDGLGGKVQRAEVRFDDIAGCLRTPGGGSSRQTVLIVEGNRIKSRLLSPREAARLMGLPDGYKLPTRYNDAYQVAGDGVCVPVVRYLAHNIFEPIHLANRKSEHAVAAER